jgi:uncharacterized protein (DUF1330 family)
MAMKTSRSLTLALLIGIGLGALGVHTLYAQAKPPVYYIGEIDVTDEAGYMKDFAPKSQAAVRAGGAKILAISKSPMSLIGPPPESRIVIQQWESMEQMKAWFDSPAQKELRAIQAKYSKVRAYAVTGLPPK